MKLCLKLFGTLWMILLLTSACLFAGNTGKIIGRVVDENGQPLPGVSILVVGTQRGASTDPDGRYAIIGVPIGVYTLKAGGVGFGTKEVTNVKVGADETSSLNFTLSSTVIDRDVVTVTADAQLVNSLITSSTTTTSSKTIESIPNVKSVEDVLKLQAGVVKKGNNIFLRGGRANEVQYLVDGIPTNNVLGNTGSTANANDDIAKFTSGNQGATVAAGGLQLSANAIQSLSVQSSFDADYGNAQSGIINIVTKSGGDHYSSSMQFRTDRVSPSNQNENYTSFTLGGPEPLTKYLLPSLGVTIPGNLSFFLNADVDRNDGANTFVDNQFYHPIERKIQLNGFLGGILNGLGFHYKDNQSNKFTFNTKLSYNPASSDQLSYGYRASLSSTHDYNPVWKYRADSSALGATLSIQNNFSWSHFFSGSSFLRLSLGKAENHDGNDVAGVTPGEYSNADNSFDTNLDGFNDLGTNQRWYKSLTNVYTAKLDFNSQVHPLHLLKTGVEFNYEEIISTEILFPTVPSTDKDGNVIYPPFPDYLGKDRGEFPGYGRHRWATTAYPNHGAAYIQDNIEFSGLNLHVGLRYEYLDVGKQVYDDNWVQAWKLATSNYPADWLENQRNGNTFLYYLLHGNVSPRLSIGYPVTDRIVFYFNYGHFLQFPDRDNYYRDPYIPGPTNGNIFVGNPNLKPQRTVSYEAGFEDQFTDDMAFGVHAFYKDIFDYPAALTRSNAKIFVNLDYASTRGFELTFNQSFSGNFSANASYTYQLAKGRAANPLASIFTPNVSLSRETRLDIDQNHTANVLVNYRVGPKEQGKFFGLPFVNNYGISMTWRFGSGFPYTPYVARQTTRNLFLINNETKPSTSTVDLSMYKGLLLMDKINVLLTLDITNLFNRRNPENIFNYTGAPFKFGDVDAGDINVIYPYSKSELRNDLQFDAPRQIIFGVKLNLD